MGCLAWFLYLAYGSVCESETQTMISGDVGYMKKEKLQELREELVDIVRMLKAMIKSLENKHCVLTIRIVQYAR